jgi:hypothetical protein
MEPEELQKPEAAAVLVVLMELDQGVEHMEGVVALRFLVGLIHPVLSAQSASFGLAAPAHSRQQELLMNNF